MNKSIFLLAIFFSATLSSYGEQPESCVCLAPAQLTVSHNFGRGVGHKGYSSADLFFIRSDGRLSSFADLRLHVMDEGRIAFNTGAGFRRLTSSDQVSVGANLYYDYRNSPKLRTQQIAGGIELLSECIDFRLNGYVPVGGYKHNGPKKFVGFSGNAIHVEQNTYYAFPSANAELGIPLPWIAPRYIDAYVGIGPYYLFGDTLSEAKYPNSWGGKFRLAATFADYFEVEFEINRDRVFHTTYQGVVALNIPLYKKTACRGAGGCKGRDAYYRRTLQPVMRNEIIPVKKKKTESALNDGSGNTFQIFFVNNLAACPGLGTFDSPFCSLTEASAAPGGPVVIYVLEGNSSVSPYTGNFAMKQGQILQGSAFPLAVNGVVIPPMSAGNPVLTNGGGTAVTVDSNTTVNGLTIEGTGGSSIFGGSVANIVITNNTIDFAGNDGIEIGNHTGNLLISGNVVTSPIQNGIAVDMSAGPGEAQVLNNTLINAPGSGVLIRLNDPNAIGLVAYNNFSSNVMTAYDIGTEVTQGDLTISHNVMNSATLFGIHALDGKQTITNNQIYNSGNGIALAYSNTGLSMSTNQAYISDNQLTVTNNTCLGIDIVVNSPLTSVFAEVKDNIVSTANLAFGISGRMFTPGSVCLSITGNTTTTFRLEGTTGPFNVQQTQALYNSSNTASVGFVEVPTVNFGSSCVP